MQELKILIEQAQAGEMDAFEQVVRRFQDMAYGYAYSILGDFHLAEDAAQEAFVEAYRHLKDLREPEAFPGWFRRLVFKQCDRLFRRRRVETVPLDEAVAVAAGEGSPAHATEKREMEQQVRNAVFTLPEPQRAVTTLFYIDGYSQAEVAEFLEVPVTTVKKRLHDSRRKLKERMMAMVTETLKEHMPDERFSQAVIDKLLARPEPLKIPGHPVRQIWDLIQEALPAYDVVTGEEIEDKRTALLLEEDMNRTYRIGEDAVLRTQTAITAIKAIRGRTPPVRLLTAGRVFRSELEDATRLKVFHQADGICIDRGLDPAALKALCEELIRKLLGAVESKWDTVHYAAIEHGLELAVKWRGTWMDVLGCGMWTPIILRESGFDPKTVTGFGFGLGLERIAMMKLGLDDIRKLWQPPYVP